MIDVEEVKSGGNGKKGSGLKVRKYKPEDRKAVRRICADTGFLSNPIDPVFEDRELFADFLTRYYTDWEPESSFVLLNEGEIRGYLTGCRELRRHKRFMWQVGPSLVLRLLWNYFFVYGKRSRAFVRWIIMRGRKETPYTPKGMPHLHINLLKDSQGVRQTRLIVDAFFTYLGEAGDTHVYGQVVGYETRRSKRTFARYGMEVVDEVEVSKYRELVDHPVYCFTFIKDLRENTKLYGNDIWKKEGE